LTGRSWSAVSDFLVPEFSVISLAGNLTEAFKTGAISFGIKTGLLGSMGAYGRMLTTTATNLSAYPGQAATAGLLAEKGLFWSNTAAGSVRFLGYAGAGVSLYSTGVDALARYECRSVK
jgi:hypothetical protein